MSRWRFSWFDRKDDVAPLISVCIPVHKKHPHLDECLSSVLNQTLDNWELFVVDDGSPRNLTDAVSAFAERTSNRVVCLREEVNRGPSAARNVAIEHSEGEYIAFLDSDDVWHPHHLAKSYEVIGASNADLSYSTVLEFSDSMQNPSATRAPGHLEQKNLPTALFYRNCIIPSAVLVKRSALVAAGMYDINLRYAEDMDLWLRLLKTDCRFAHTGNATCGYRQHPAAATANTLLVNLHRAMVLNRYANWRGVSPWARHVRRAHIWLKVWRESLNRFHDLSKLAAREAIRSLTGFASEPESPILAIAERIRGTMR